MVENFTPVSGLIGGLLIGLAIALMMLLNGRIAGISGIARLNRRSIIATLAFMDIGVITVFLTGRALEKVGMLRMLVH